MRHQLLCSGSQWGHLGDQEIGRDGQEETEGRWWRWWRGFSFLSSPNSQFCPVSGQTRGRQPSRDGATVCVVLELTLTRRGGEFANIFFSPPLYTITSLRDVLPYISPSQGVSRKYFQILTPLSGDTAGVNHVNVNFHEFHIKFGSGSAAFQVTFTDRPTD